MAEKIDSPEIVEPVVTEPEPKPVDQTVQDDPTPSALTLSSIVQTHSDDHPGFNPDVHATNGDGSPKLRSDGSYAKKRGRKPGQTLPPKSDNAQASDRASDATVKPMEVGAMPPRISPDEAARQSANLLINGMVILCGEEIGKPQSKEEAGALLFSFKNYYDTRGVPNIPPEIGLILGVGSYALPRIRASETAQNKLQRFMGWAKAKFDSLRGK